MIGRHKDEDLIKNISKALTAANNNFYFNFVLLSCRNGIDMKTLSLNIRAVAEALSQQIYNLSSEATDVFLEGLVSHFFSDNVPAIFMSIFVY